MDTETSLGALYDEYFAVIPADTADLLDQAHALRYQVYCVENPFEDPADHPEGREFDEFDVRSVHMVLIYRSTGTVAGCARLVLPDPQDSRQTLPVRQVLEPEGVARLDRYPIQKTAEISRYAVSKQFRRRAGETMYPDTGFFDLPQDSSRRLMPHITLGLMQGLARLSVQYGIEYVCATMAPPLLRLLRRFGLEFEDLGPLVDYHGLRQPCMASCQDLLAGMETKSPDYYEIVKGAYESGGRLSAQVGGAAS